MHLNSVTKEERKAVEDLVESTWEADKAGAGADARNLAHTAIQVGTKDRTAVNLGRYHSGSCICHTVQLPEFLSLPALVLL